MLPSKACAACSREPELQLSSSCFHGESADQRERERHDPERTRLAFRQEAHDSSGPDMDRSPAMARAARVRSIPSTTFSNLLCPSARLAAALAPGPDVTMAGESAANPRGRVSGNSDGVIVDPSTLPHTRREFVGWFAGHGRRCRPRSVLGCADAEWAMGIGDSRGVRHNAHPLRFRRRNSRGSLKTARCAHSLRRVRFFTPPRGR